MRRDLVIALMLVAACGGGKAGPAADTPKPPPERPPPEPAETEVDREARRRKAALAIVPADAKCLPTELRTRARLEVAAIGNQPVLCAYDTDPKELLGPLGCWKLELSTGELVPREPAPLPGVGFAVRLDDRCARGFCLPKTAELPDSGIVWMAYNLDGSKLAVLAGDEVYVFDTRTRERVDGFGVRGEQGITDDPIAMHFFAGTIFIEAGTANTAGVWSFKQDGTAQGPLLGTDDKPLSTSRGSLLLLDRNRVAVAEQGFSVVTVIELDTGKRQRITRATPRGRCTPAELTAYWQGDKVGDKCAAHVEATFAHLIGATAVAGARNWLVLLRGPRLGELIIVDASNLTEKQGFKLEWCPAPAETEEEEEEEDDEEEEGE